MSLIPWDLNSGSVSFGLDKNRRSSYLFATQYQRPRSESYRKAARLDELSEGSGHDVNFDFIDDLLKKSGEKEQAKETVVSIKPRFNKFRERTENRVETADAALTKLNGNVVQEVAARFPYEDDTGVVPGEEITQCDGVGLRNGGIKTLRDNETFDSVRNRSDTETSRDTVTIQRARWKYIKNLFVICISYILAFTAFRSLQNLQSSLHKSWQLGNIVMAVFHSFMVFTSFFVPVVVNKLSSKWSIVVALLCYCIWMCSNMIPIFTILIPCAIIGGFGHSLAWTSQTAYVTKLTIDFAQTSRLITDREIMKYNGVFLAGFQTSHLWGNLVSSIILTPQTNETDLDSHLVDQPCGILEACDFDVPPFMNYTMMPIKWAPINVTRLTLINVGMGFIGCLVVLFFLDAIHAQHFCKKPTCEFFIDKIDQLFGDEIFRLLIPFFLFNGFEQGVIYADFTRAYITCAMGVENIGYCMIIFGVGNFLSSIVVSLLNTRISREIVIGVCAILHGGLIAFMLLWVPSKQYSSTLLVVSAIWGLCDAVWQTQSNHLIGISSMDRHEIAFSNFRLLQGVGASTAFGLSAMICVRTKLYVTIGLMSVCVIFYSIAEYKLKREENRRQQRIPQIRVELATPDPAQRRLTR